MVSPEIITEQVMGYTVGAQEMIPTLKVPKSSYITALVPYGPNFYTGLLQAAACLLLDGQKKKLLILSEQDYDPKNIVIDTHSYGPVCGKKRSLSIKRIYQRTQQLKAKQTSQDNSSKIVDIHEYLSFVRVILDIEECMHIAIGNTLSQTAQKRFLSWLARIHKDYLVVVLANVDVAISKSKKNNNEEKSIEKSIVGSNWSGSCAIEIYKQLNMSLQKPIQIIAYVDPNARKKNNTLTTRYVCAVS